MGKRRGDWSAVTIATEGFDLSISSFESRCQVLPVCGRDGNTSSSERSTLCLYHWRKSDRRMDRKLKRNAATRLKHDARSDSYIKYLHMGLLHETKAWFDLICVGDLVEK